MNANKTEYMYFNGEGDISTLNGNPLNIVDKFTYFNSSVSSTKSDVSIRLTKAWTAIDRLSIILIYVYSITTLIRHEELLYS